MGLLRLLEDLGGEKIEKTKEGYRLRCLNPNHEDKTPSMYVNEAKGVFYCFGCGWGGSIVKLVQELLGISRQEAVEVVTGYGVKLGPITNLQEEKTSSFSYFNLDKHDLVKAPVEIVHYVTVVRKFPIYFLRSFDVGWFKYGNHLGLVFDYKLGENMVRVLRYINSQNRYRVFYDGELRLPYYLKGEGKNLYCVEGVFDALRIKQYFPSANVLAFLGTLQTSKRLFISHLHKRLGGDLIFLLDDDEGGYKHAEKIRLYFPNVKIEFISPDPDSAPLELLQTKIKER